jgi:hypothetical protein
VHDQQLVDMAGLDGPHRLFAQHGNVGHALRPADHALRPRHQPHDPARVGQIGAQEWHREAETGHGLPVRLGPERRDLLAEGFLHRAPELAAVIEISQVLYVQMHCGEARYRST